MEKNDEHIMIHPLSDLLERSKKPSRTVVGLMSGTSADSIDVAVCRLNGHGSDIIVELVCYREHAHDADIRRQVLQAANLDVRAVAELNVHVGEVFAASCLATLHEAGLSSRDVDVIGSHGQTIYHHSGVAGARRATLQLGDGDVIAVRTGSLSSPTSALATSPRGVRAPRSRRSPMSYCSAGVLRTKPGTAARSSISAESPISRCSTTILLAHSGSTPDRRTHRWTGWRAALRRHAPVRSRRADRQKRTG